MLKGLALHAAYGYARGAPVIQEALSRLRTGDGIGELTSPFGVVVSLAFIREPTHRIRIWDEVGGGPPPLVPDQP